MDDNIKSKPEKLDDTLDLKAGALTSEDVHNQAILEPGITKRVRKSKSQKRKPNELHESDEPRGLS